MTRAANEDAMPAGFSAYLQAALSKAAPSTPRWIVPTTTLADLDRALATGPVSPGTLLADAAIVAFKAGSGTGGERGTRAALKFLTADRRATGALRCTPESAPDWGVEVPKVLTAMANANTSLELLYDIFASRGVDVFSLLGLRNLSSFVGEMFASQFCKANEDRFCPNPNQDGHPDLCALTPDGLAYIGERRAGGQMTEKRFWSPFPHGGVEIKATCGDTPPAHEEAKPKIGQSRLPSLSGLTWKAHHRETNNLLAVFWDFVDGIPTVLAAFYRNDLTPDDWGKVVTPKAGSRTTSVSIMVKGSSTDRAGVKKMGDGWLVLPSDPVMLRQLCQRAVFDLREADISRVCSTYSESPASASGFRERNLWSS